MPIYEYEPDEGGCVHCRGGFEVMQNLHDKPLTQCPQCACAVHRLISRPARPGRNILSNSNLADKGFTKYVKRSDGKYTKETGPGPDLAT